MSSAPQEIFERCVWAGMTGNAVAPAEMFTADGVFEAPLVPAGRAFPGLLAGGEAIRDGMAAYYERPVDAGRTVNVDRPPVRAARRRRPGLE
ncbi:hypothetical protein [Streptosporangium sp. NPDC049644]|uniref:hypothetical protein n=1 Tax=Streptosporangium sp. NPDC049644 TaxID=3155507 RepID=UPI0034151D68